MRNNFNFYCLFEHYLTDVVLFIHHFCLLFFFILPSTATDRQRLKVVLLEIVGDDAGKWRHVEAQGVSGGWCHRCGKPEQQQGAQTVDRPAVLRRPKTRGNRECDAERHQHNVAAFYNKKK